MPKGGVGRKPRKLERAARRGLTRRLRDALAARPLEIGEMSAELQADQKQVLAALRRLGQKKRGRLRSGVLDGRNCWWWEEPQEPQGEGAASAETAETTEAPGAPQAPPA